MHCAIDPKYRYWIWNPGEADRVDAAQDWNIGDLRTTDRSLALSQPYRVATVPALCTDPEVWCHVPVVQPGDLARFDAVLITDAEYFDPIRVQQWCQDCGIKNYRVATSGQWQGRDLPPQFVYRAFYIRPFLAQNQSQVLERTHRPYLFDALLGARRPHRDYVMLAMSRTGLLDRSIVTYRDCFPGAVINDTNAEYQKLFGSTELSWPYMSPHLDPAWEVSDRVTNQISFIAPWEIYRRTWYSIVCETLGTGSGYFLSEKTIKAMYAGRVFVVFAPQGYLSWLRDQGFATFDGIIDESYDQEPRDAFRYRKAMAQIMQLAWFERPQDVYQWAHEVLEQNQRRLVELDQQRSRDLIAAAQQCIPPEHWDYATA